jgi:galactosyl transferase GMA12/MNN10 family
MNPHTPLEIFLPPAAFPQLANMHLLMAKNMDGLNSGVFALRVHPWSVSILSTILAYPIFEAQRSNTDRFRDQSAFQWLLQPNQKSPLFNAPYQGKENWAEVPMRWFNSLPFNNAFSKKWDWIFNYNMTDELFDNGTTTVYKDGHGGYVKPWKVMQGDMVVHFAGSDPVRGSWMGRWLERCEAYLPEWSNATKKYELETEAFTFWEGIAARIDRQRAIQRPPTSTTSKTATETVQLERFPEKLLVDTRYGNVPTVSARASV